METAPDTPTLEPTPTEPTLSVPTPEPTAPAMPRSPWRAVALLIAGVAVGVGATTAVHAVRGGSAETTGTIVVGITTTTIATSTTMTVPPAPSTTVPPTTASPAPPTSVAPTEPPPPPPPQPEPPTTAAPPTILAPVLPGATFADQQHPCDALTVDEVRIVVPDVVRVAQMDRRCRYVRTTGGEGVVVTIAAFPTEASAVAGLRDARRLLTDARCRSAAAGDEAYVCTVTSGPIGATGFARLGLTVLRVDVVGPTDVIRLGEVLRIGASRLPPKPVARVDQARSQ